MDIAELTRLMHEFVRAKGGMITTPPANPRNLAISLSIEAAGLEHSVEWRPGRSRSLAELAAVMLYLLQLASVTGIDLGRPCWTSCA